MVMQEPAKFYEEQRIMNIKKESFVVLSTSKMDTVAICVCENETHAKLIVEGRRKLYTDYCWYQKVEVIR